MRQFKPFSLYVRNNDYYRVQLNISLYPLLFFANTPFKPEKNVAEIRFQGEFLFYFEDLTLIQSMFTALRPL